MGILQKTIVTVFGLTAFVAIGTIALLGIAIEDEPGVQVPAAVDYQTVAASKELFKRILHQVESTNRTITVTVSESEMKNLAQMGSHSFPGLRADASIEGQQLLAGASLELPRNPFGGYLNVSVQVVPSSDRLAIEKLEVGALPLPAAYLLPAIELLADIILPEQQVTQVLSSVSSVRLEQKNALFTLAPSSGNVKSDIKETVKRLQASRFPPGEQERVVYYYGILAGIAPAGSSRQRSLTYFLSPLLAEASRRSLDGDAVAQNRAVIWALAIYFSYGEFENLVGDLVSATRALAFPALNVTLDARRDLMQHFLYSAGITLATQQGVGIAAGEFKELLDSGEFGSGFSFSDLAADRAGVAFAMSAIAGELQARHVQQAVISDPSESRYFPDVSGLPDGLSEADFRRQFENTQSQAYQALVDTIDRRIEGLEIHGPLEKD